MPRMMVTMCVSLALWAGMAAAQTPMSTIYAEVDAATRVVVLGEFAKGLPAAGRDEDVTVSFTVLTRGDPPPDAQCVPKLNAQFSAHMAALSDASGLSFKIVPPAQMATINIVLGSVADPKSDLSEVDLDSWWEAAKKNANEELDYLLSSFQPPHFERAHLFEGLYSRRDLLLRHGRVKIDWGAAAVYGNGDYSPNEGCSLNFARNVAWLYAEALRLQLARNGSDDWALQARSQLTGEDRTQRRQDAEDRYYANLFCWLAIRQAKRPLDVGNCPALVGDMLNRPGG